MANLSALLAEIESLSLHELETLYQDIQQRRRAITHKHGLRTGQVTAATPGQLTEDQVNKLIREIINDANTDVAHS